MILPMTATVAISYGVRKFLCADSIYTLKLTRRGHHMPEALQANFPMVRLARDLMEKRLTLVPAAGRLDLLVKSPTGHPEYFLVEEEGWVVGIIKRDAALERLARNGAEAAIQEVANKHFAIVAETTALFDIVGKCMPKTSLWSWWPQKEARFSRSGEGRDFQGANC